MLNFENLTLCLWEKMTWGLTYSDQFISQNLRSVAVVICVLRVDLNWKNTIS